jgi:hypothetical protein
MINASINKVKANKAPIIVQRKSVNFRSYSKNIMSNYFLLEALEKSLAFVRTFYIYGIYYLYFFTFNFI